MIVFMLIGLLPSTKTRTVKESKNNFSVYSWRLRGHRQMASPPGAAEAKRLSETSCVVSVLERT